MPLYRTSAEIHISYMEYTHFNVLHAASVMKLQCGRWMLHGSKQFSEVQEIVDLLKRRCSKHNGFGSGGGNDVD